MFIFVPEFEESPMDRKFAMDVPCQCYDIDEFKYLSFDEHVDLYMKMYREKITDAEKIDLFAHKKYVRFMCFQDTPDSRAYMYAYCRSMDDMMPEHKKEAIEVLQNFKGSMILGEINYSKKGYFFMYEFCKLGLMH
jgi:hypothetical protein